MAEYMTLLGTEQVERAANTMRQAAEDMRQAAGTLDYALENHRRQMDEWLYRFQQVVEEATKKIVEVNLRPVDSGRDA